MQNYLFWYFKTEKFHWRQKIQTFLNILFIICYFLISFDLNIYEYEK